MVEQIFEASVGMSRKWDARDAGREVAKNSLNKLKNEPNYFLVLSTIHYEKHGGFEEFLKGIYEILPQKIPLIGGTVAGFMNKFGCYTRGTSAVAVSNPNMKVTTGIGKNTRKNPKNAAKQISKSILRDHSNSEFKNQFLFCILPGGTVPQLLGFGRKKVMKSGVGGKISLNLLDQSIKLVQMGPGREEEVFEFLGDNLSDWYIFGGSSMDDLNQSRCYQFINNEVHSTDIVGLGISSDLNCKIITKYGLKKTGKKFHITKKGLRDCVICEIDGKPATKEFLKMINWPEDYLDDRLYTKTFYYPLGYEYKGVLRPQIIGAFLGDNIACGYSIKSDEVEILNATGNSLLNAMINATGEVLNYDSKLILGVACATQLETLGNSIYQAYDKLDKRFKEIPFLIGFYAGEESYSPVSPPKQLYDSFNLSCFY